MRNVTSAELVNTINFKMHGERVLTLIVGQNGVTSLAYDEETGFLVATLRLSSEPRWIPMSNVKTMTMAVDPVTTFEVGAPVEVDVSGMLPPVIRGPGRPRKVGRL